MNLSDTALMDQAGALGAKLLARGIACATAESCTGGWVAKVLTDVAGSSQWFNGGLVTYTNEAKASLLGVSGVTLDSHGAVSEQTVIAMAQGAAHVMGTELAIAISGIAGPGGETPGKPVGTVCFGLAYNGVVEAWTQRFEGDREAVRRASVGYALHRMADAVS